MNTGENEKKILKQFRLSATSVTELESLSDDSQLDMTEIVEVAIANVRPIIEKLMKRDYKALVTQKLLDEYLGVITPPPSYRRPK